jgi:SHS2 domain-containing protein
VGGYAVFEHTADIGIEAWGASREEALAQAGRALFAVIAEPEGVEPRQTYQVRVEVAPGSADSELLVEWLNELIFLFETRHCLLADFDVRLDGERRLVARVAGEPYDPGRHALHCGVKAATYHGAALQQVDGTWRARAILDL